MSNPFTLDDGTELPAPVSRTIHRYKSHNSDHLIECRVDEVVQRTTNGPLMRSRMPMMLTLAASANDPRWDWVAQDYLVAVVAHRASEGWEVVSVGKLGACLKRG
jgi:hypothetical protein